MRCAVLGDPIEHSLSPALHRAAYVALGLDWTYDAVRVPSGGLADFLAGLDEEWRGLSLTMPLKREAMPLLTSRDSWADLAGAANTVLLDRDGVARAQHRRTGCDRSPARGHAGVARACGRARRWRDRHLGPAGAGRARLRLRRDRRTRRGPGRGDDRRPYAAIRTRRISRPCSWTSWRRSSPTWSCRRSRPRRSPPRCSPRWPTPRSCSTSSTTRGRLRLAATALADGRLLVGGLDLLLWQAVDQVRAMTGRFDVPVAAMRAAGEAGLAERRR